MKVRVHQMIAVWMMGVALVSSANQPATGREKMQQAVEIGASCTGFYDGVYALLHRLTQQDDNPQLAHLRSIWPHLNTHAIFRHSTASMLMTDIFIAKMNQSFDIEPPLSLQNFSQPYVANRKSTMAWQPSITRDADLTRMRHQCEQVIRISAERGTLREDILKKAISQRAKALGIEIEVEH